MNRIVVTDFKLTQRSRTYLKSETYISELLAVFLLFKLLPVPVNLNILLMRLDNLILNFVGTLLLVFLFEGTALFVDFLRIDTNLYNLLLSVFSHLLQSTYQKNKKA